MRSRRENCVVLDTSILPSRPEMSAIEKFVVDQLRPDMSQVRCVQPHNVKNVVYLCMASSEAASNVAATHHLQHCMEAKGKKFPIPIYLESSAVIVRSQDLPYDMDNSVITDHMRQYGEVITIRNEVWKSYFPGLINEVRVVRMKLTKSIPSYITVDDEPTLITYHSQTKTCRNYGNKFHPKRTCNEAAAAAKAETADCAPGTSTMHISDTNGQQQNSNTQQSNEMNGWPTWPTLSTPKQQTDGQQKKAHELKRQRSNDSETTDNGTKRMNADDTNGTDDENESLISMGSSLDICQYTNKPYRIPSYIPIYIPDLVERQAIIAEDKMRIDAAYREMELQKQKKKLQKK